MVHKFIKNTQVKILREILKKNKLYTTILMITVPKFAISESEALFTVPISRVITCGAKLLNAGWLREREHFFLIIGYFW